MDYTEVVKNQYFSQDNLDFIITVVKSKTDNLISHESVFKIRNNIFNSFIHSLYSQRKTINPESIEDLLITLNKMTIENIIKDSSQPQVQPQLQLQVRSQPQIQVQPQVQPQVQVQLQSQEQSQLPLRSQEENKIQMIDNEIQTDIFTVNNKESLYIFLNDYPFENETYNLEFRKKKMHSLKLKRVELFNNLYNINESNNKMEFMENNIKKNIYIPVGCYNLDTLISVFEKQLNEKFNNSTYKIIYNIDKNRLSISNEKPFTFTFIESEGVIPLRFILGFSNKQYVNNTNYTSDLNPIVNIYDNLYLKFSPYEYLNNKYTKDFRFFQHIKLNSVDSFGKTINIDINELMNHADIDDIKLEIYYRHIHHNKFYKVKLPLSMILIFDIEF